ncbi:hypothetical protein INH39_21725 [Massilia violaceinigra]|uniref:Uncharacterized protein n=1 Tax=Massilia violaceinigra TaxID=2045208 RepID=A0ABY4A3C8_9BURK|nr:hypothetical protein [Massilia violaceinigra]UOD28076.1 hypothetical protein INH39_21725 [Massilia violaceinigra]
MNAHSSLPDTQAAHAGQRAALWNPDAAACWSLLFTPLFGTILVIRNWEALGEPKRAVQACWWFAACLAALILNVYISLLREAPNPLQTGPIVLLLVWYIAVASPQERFVRERLGTDYARRSWAIALPCALALLLAYLLGYAHLLAVLQQVH